MQGCEQQSKGKEHDLNVNLELAEEIQRCDEKARYFAECELPKEGARKAADYFCAAQEQLFAALVERL